jgi:hypothetical protein
MQEKPLEEKPQYPIIPKPLPFWQRVLHGIVLLLGWACYLAFVLYVIMHASLDEIRFLFSFVLICFICIPMLTLFWIKHNRRIFQKKGPRKQFQQVKESYDVDWLNVPVIADWDSLKEAKKISIIVGDNSKRFEVVNKFVHINAPIDCA